MKRILFLSMVYPRAYDPTRGTFCYATCKALAASHEVCVVSPVAWTERLRGRNPVDPQSVREVGRSEFPGFYYPPGILHSTYGWWMWQSIRRRLLAIARDFRPDGIISYWAHPDGEVAVRLGRQLGIPSSIIVGGSDVLLLPRNPARKRVIVAALAGTDAVFTVSRDLREKTIALGVAPERVHLVYQGVDEAFTPGDQIAARQQLGLPEDRELILWVGKMVPVKGLEVLLESFQRLIIARPRAMLVLVGDGPLRANLEQQVRARQLVDHVRLAGAVTHDQLPNWYRSADVTALSSHSEGIPNVLRESLACGTPYVATHVGGISELCDHPAIRLVPPRDPAALADALASSLAGRERIPFDLVERGWGAYASRLVDLLAASRVHCAAA